MGDRFWTDIKRGTLMRLRFSDGQEGFRRITSVRHTRKDDVGDVIETVITSRENPGADEPGCEEISVRHDD